MSKFPLRFIKTHNNRGEMAYWNGFLFNRKKDLHSWDNLFPFFYYYGRAFTDHYNQRNVDQGTVELFATTGSIIF